jgi:hypothetical protein
MLPKPKIVFFLGLLVSIILLTAAVLPYVLAWQSFHSMSTEANVINVNGIAYADGEQTSLINVTLIAVYPRAAVEAYSDMFAVDLFFLVSLDSNITEFICYDIEVDFRGVNWTDVYYGWKDLDVQSGTLVDFHHVNNIGNIAPFLVNVSMNIDSGTWPPFNQDVSHLLYLTDQIETFPYLVLNGRIEIGSNCPDIGVLFNMTKHSTIICRFNYPPTVWIAYGASAFIMIAVSLNLFYKRRSETHQ